MNLRLMMPTSAATDVTSSPACAQALRPAVAQPPARRQPLVMNTEGVIRMETTTAFDLMHRENWEGLNIELANIASDPCRPATSEGTSGQATANDPGLMPAATTQGPVIGSTARTAARALPSEPAGVKLGSMMLVTRAPSLLALK